MPPKSVGLSPLAIPCIWLVHHFLHLHCATPAFHASVTLMFIVVNLVAILMGFSVKRAAWWYYMAGLIGMLASLISGRMGILGIIGFHPLWSSLSVSVLFWCAFKLCRQCSQAWLCMASSPISCHCQISIVISNNHPYNLEQDLADSVTSSKACWKTEKSPGISGRSTIAPFLPSAPVLNLLSFQLHGFLPGLPAASWSPDPVLVLLQAPDDAN